jgi:hypothetical protein
MPARQATLALEPRTTPATPRRRTPARRTTRGAGASPGVTPLASSATQIPRVLSYLSATFVFPYENVVNAPEMSGSNDIFVREDVPYRRVSRAAPYGGRPAVFR